MAKATKKTDILLVSSDVYGIVKWFNKGTGQISIKPYGDVFVHFSHITKAAPKCYNPQKFLVKGQNVKCDLLCGPKGLQARKVIVVNRDRYRPLPDDNKQSVTFDIPDAKSVHEESSSDSDEGEPKKTHNIVEKDLRGEVLSYAHGLGFVLTPKYGSIICHNSDIIFSGEGTSEKKLLPTQFVKCDLARGPKGLMAVNVCVICEVSSAVATDGDSQTSRARRDRYPSASRQPKKIEETVKAPTQVKAEKQSKKDPAKERPQPQRPEPPKKQSKPKEAEATSTSDSSKGDSPKKAKADGSSAPQTMSQPTSAPACVSSEKPPFMAPSTVPRINPNYRPSVAPNYPYLHPRVQELSMHKPAPPHTQAAFGSPSPYMAPPPYPGQMTQLLDMTHIGSSSDPCVKPAESTFLSFRCERVFSFFRPIALNFLYLSFIFALFLLFPLLTLFS